MSRKKGLLEHIQVSSADLQRACGKLPTPRQLGRRLPGRAQPVAATPPIELVGLTICSTVVMSTLKYHYSPAFALDVHFGRSASCGCTGGISSFNQTVEERTGIRGQSKHCCGGRWPSDWPRSATSLTGPWMVRR